MRYKYLTDAAADDSDKSLTVPSGRVYTLIGGRATLVTTATVGNRQVDLEIKDDSGNVIFTVPAAAVQAASLTRQYEYKPGEAAPAALAGTRFVCPFPPGLALLPGWSLHVFDSAAIAAGADDLTLRFLVRDEAAQIGT